MKKLASIVFILAFVSGGIAQNSINYKALIKDTNGNVLASSPINIQFIIYEGAALTNNVYQESHAVITDTNGFAIVNIGDGATSDDFNFVNWNKDEHYLNVQVDIGSGLVDLGTTQFMAVPYALSSGDHPWTKDENGIYSLDNNIGVNSENPEHTLDIRSTSQAEPSGLNISNSDKSRYLRFFSGSDMFPDPSITLAPGRNLLFASFDDNTLDFQEYMRISSIGDVGIGIPNPEARLDVKGGDWNLDAGNPGDFRIGSLAHNFRIGVATGGGGAGITRMYTNSNDLILGTNNNAALKLGQDGSITAPNITISQIDNAGNKSLITKEYADNLVLNSGIGKTITIPPNSMIINLSSTIITISSSGLRWENNTSAGAQFAVKKPNDYNGGDVEFSIFFSTASGAPGVVEFFIRPRSFNNAELLADAGSISSSGVNVSGDFNFVYEQKITIPADRLTNDWWYFTIQRNTASYTGHVNVKSVALSY